MGKSCFPRSQLAEAADRCWRTVMRFSNNSSQSLPAHQMSIFRCWYSRPSTYSARTDLAEDPHVSTCRTLHRQYCAWWQCICNMHFEFSAGSGQLSLPWHMLCEAGTPEHFLVKSSRHTLDLAPSSQPQANCCIGLDARTNPAVAACHSSRKGVGKVEACNIQTCHCRGACLDGQSCSGNGVVLDSALQRCIAASCGSVVC